MLNSIQNSEFDFFKFGIRIRIRIRIIKIYEFAFEFIFFYEFAFGEFEFASNECEYPNSNTVFVHLCNLFTQIWSECGKFLESCQTFGLSSVRPGSSPPRPHFPHLPQFFCHFLQKAGNYQNFKWRNLS